MAGIRSIHVLLIFALGIVPLAPAEHAHEIADGDGHHLLIHRHAEGHHESHAPGGDEHNGVVDHDEVPLLTRATIATVPTPPYIHISFAVLASGYLPPPPLKTPPLAERHTQVPIHGPPRAPASLRGPPVSPAL